MTRYELTHAAREDIKSLAARVAEDKGLHVADRILSELDDKLSTLVEFPGIGRPRPDLTDAPVKLLPFYSWLIVYDAATKPLQIIRVVNAWRRIGDVL